MQVTQLSHPFFLVLWLLAGTQLLSGQTVHVLRDGNQPDSSYYDIARVGANEFWAGGENGLLHKIDSSGRTTRLNLPGRAVVDVLKIVPAGRYVYVAGSQGSIFRYDRNAGTWITASYEREGFGKLAFYDLVMMNDGSLIASGGHQRVAKGQVAIPRGFVARLDPELLRAPEIVWSHGLMFSFSMAYDPGRDELFLSAFNGVNTHLFSSVDGALTFQRQGSLPGLVHHLRWHDGDLWFSGAKSLRYSRTGLAGKRGERSLELPGEGCIWSLLPLNGTMYCLAFNGAVVAPNAAFDNYQNKGKVLQHSIYEGVAVSGRKALLVGHGGSLLMMELEETAGSTASFRVMRP